MSARRVFTEDEVEDLLAKALKKQARPDIGKLKKSQEKAILAGELAREKKQRLSELRGAPIDEQIEALGGEHTLSPLQLVKLRANAPSQFVGSASGASLHNLVLGNSPSTTYLSRFGDVSQALRGKGVRMNDDGEIVISGYPIPGSDLVQSLQYLIKGVRGRRKPSGTDEIAKLLREGGIPSSKFPPQIRPLLGGKVGRRAAKTPIAAYDDSEDELSQQLSDVSLTEESDGEQHGSGLDFLHAACDHAEYGNHDDAFDALNAARQAKAPRDKIKKVERYIASLRD